MAVLKKIFSSLKNLFRKKKHRRKPKRKTREKVLSRRAPRKAQRKSRPAHTSPKKIKKKQNASSRKSLRLASAPAVPLSRIKISPAQTPHPGQPVGEITHFFSKIQVIVVKMGKGRLAVGDKIRVHGKVTDFTQTVRSMQIESVDVRCARSGQLIGLKVERAARVGDRLYKPV